MAIVINGSGTVTGLAVGGLPDGTVDAGTVAADVATQAEIDAKLNLSGGTMTGNLNIIQATSGTGSSAVKELIYNEGAGDAALHLALSGSTDWYVGADNTDNSLKIGQASWDSSPYLAIDTTGAVTMPAQPAFLATANGSSQTNVGLAETVNFGTEVFDQNSDYNNSTSVFTAPITGKYNLTGTVRTGELDTNTGFYRIEIQTSNRTYKFEIIDTDKLYSADPLYHSFHFNTLADMDSGDTASVVWIRNGGTATADISGAAQYTFFSGHLVC